MLTRKTVYVGAADDKRPRFGAAGTFMAQPEAAPGAAATGAH